MELPIYATVSKMRHCAFSRLQVFTRFDRYFHYLGRIEYSLRDVPFTEVSLKSKLLEIISLLYTKIFIQVLSRCMISNNAGLKAY